jgi:hypothetical protein
LTVATAVAGIGFTLASPSAKPIGWALIAVAGAIFLALLAYELWRLRRERGEEPPAHQPLQPRYGQSPPYRDRRAGAEWIAEHRVGVLNSGNETVYRVRLHLVGMASYPRHDGGMRPAIPYVVPLLAGGDEGVGITLPPGQEELWVLGYTATAIDGSMNAGGFSNKRWQGTPWRLDEDERWRFSYQIVYEGRPAVAFSIVLYPDAGVVRCLMEG